MAADDLIHVTRWHNGEKSFSPFSDGEMARRRDAMQARMDHAGIEACLFTSYHNICYFSVSSLGFGRRYGAVLNSNGVTTVSASIVGGQLQRQVSDNVTYSDWRRDAVHRAEGPAGRGEASWHRI